MSESQTNFGHEMQAMKKAMAELQSTDYATKCKTLEAKLQHAEAAHKAEALSLQERLNKLLESSSTPAQNLPVVSGNLPLPLWITATGVPLKHATGMTISELQRECGESRKEKQILMQVTL
jgi:Sec-independent protein translocase protein TatA